MANSFFTLTKESVLDAEVNFATGTFKVDLIDTADHNPNTATEDFYNDITAAAIEETATLGTLATSTSGAWDSADPTFTAATGDPCEELMVWQDTGGASSTDPLVLSYDTFTSGMPVTPNGGDITVTVHASGWFTL